MAPGKEEKINKGGEGLGKRSGGCNEAMLIRGLFTLPSRPWRQRRQSSLGRQPRPPPP
jgi:hypothetical protein